MNNIYKRVNAVMQEVEYIKKDATVQNYLAVTHDNVIAQLRGSLINHGIVIVPSQIKGKLHEKSKKFDRGLKEEIIDSMRMYEAKYKIKFVNMDDPKDFIAVDIESHALDNGDKAPGKALSYATKMALLKVFSIETGVNDESRVSDPVSFTDIQKNEFDEILERGNGLDMLVYSYSVGPDIFSALYNSFEKGNISKGKKAVDELIKGGHLSIDDYVYQIRESIEKSDPSITELTGELSEIEKRLVVGRLEKHEIEYLRNLKNEPS